ncbi:MAG: DNA polymerase III subunit epsilon [Gemmatimonadaceae bacterium]
MRQIVLDTETTGLEPESGHRIIEIGCVELVNRRPTGRTFHKYINPEREIDEGALAVHGISRAELEGKPKFAEVVDELVLFISDAELVIHNAAFDVAFLEAELARIRGELRTIANLCRVLDTLALARSMHPGQRNNLDALCKRYSIDNSRRELHGALLDARILADVYLAMTGGQGALALVDTAASSSAADGGRTVRALIRPPVPLVVITATEEEIAAHAAMLAIIAKASGGKCLWPLPPTQPTSEVNLSSA